MADHKKELQASFLPLKRHAHYGDAIVRMHIKGFRNHKNTKIDIESPVTALCGVNGSGKSTVIQLAAAAYQAPASCKRYYVSDFILAGTLDKRPFTVDASMEVAYAQPADTDGTAKDRILTLSRYDSKWAGYERQPQRIVMYLGLGFHLPHAERDDKSKGFLSDDTVKLKDKHKIDDAVLEKISKILLCKYDSAHKNVIRKRWGRTDAKILSAKRDSGAEYSEANMGSGEARLYELISRIESAPSKSLLLLEEPETALHPSAQFELGRYLVEVAKEKGLQIILTTHSEYLLLALPQKARVYLKREEAGIVPIQGIGVRQAISLMDNLEVASLHILVEDDVAESIVSELLRKHDGDFRKTIRILVCGDKDKIKNMLSVFKDQNFPVCAVRDGDCGEDKGMHMFKLFGTTPPEKEIFDSSSFRDRFAAQYKIDWGAIDLANKGKDHHDWFDSLEAPTARKRAELLPEAAAAYLDAVPDADRQSLVEQIKASVP